ncbi:MAG: hypothetical protein ACR2K6_03530 [Solirubrobacterales bacterium]
MATTETESEPEGVDRLQRQETGLAHVASLAFVAARTMPGAGFPVAVGGGTAIARATEGLGFRRGLATGTAAVIESVAILGPARMSAPAGQLATAPVIGALAAAGRSQATQVAAAALTRTLFNLVGTAFFIFVIAGSVETFTGTYDGTFGRIPGAPQGTTAAFIGTGIALLGWSAAATWFQVAIYARARGRWVAERDPLEAVARDDSGASTGNDSAPTPAGPPETAGSGRLDPRAVIGAATIAFVLLLASTDPILLAGVTAWLALAWAVAPAERSVLRTGALLTAILLLTSLLVNLVGGETIGQALERAVRVGLLVAVATWMRGAAGVDGFREVVRRLLHRVRRRQLVAELRTTLDSLAGDRRMGEALRTLAARVKKVRDQDLWAIADEILEWIAEEATRFRAVPAPGAMELRYRAIDGALILGATLPCAALLG